MRITGVSKHRRHSRSVLVAVALLVPIGALAVGSDADATATPVPLGTTTSFAVLGGSTVTNTGPTVITGNVGLSPGSSVTGFPPGTINGTEYVANASADQAQIDLVTAYNAAAGEAPTSTISADLGGQTLTPGVYQSASTIGLTGALTLDAQGDPNAVFVFQAETSTLITASSSQVTLINGAQACNVFWQVGSSATLGTGSTFQGSILAMQSITVTTGVTIIGRALARNGAVTLDSDVISTPSCTAQTSTTATTTAPTSSAATGTASSSTTATPKGLTAAKNKAAAARKAAAKRAAAKRAAAKRAAAVASASTPTTIVAAPTSPIGTSIVQVTG